MNRNKLLQVLNKEGISPNKYSLYGELQSDKIILYENYNVWEIFYLDERGGRQILKRCRSEEEACGFLHQTLVTSMLLGKLVSFSHQPVILVQTVESIQTVSILEIGIRVWLDSIVMYEKNLPQGISDIIFEIQNNDEIRQNYKISFWGSRKVGFEDESVSLSIDFIPTHEWISIHSAMTENEFEKEVSTIIRKYIFHNKREDNNDFFMAKSLFIGYKNRLHPI